MSDTTYRAFGVADERLIFSMHFNGDDTPSRSTRIYIHSNNANDDTYFVYVDYNGSRFERPDLASVMRLALNNGGWGQFTIKDVTNA